MGIDAEIVGVALPFSVTPLVRSEQMEKEELHYEVKPMPVIVSRDTKPWTGKFVQAMGNVGRRAVSAFLLGCVVTGLVLSVKKCSASNKPVTEVAESADRTATVSVRQPANTLNRATEQVRINSSGNGHQEKHDLWHYAVEFLDHLGTELAIAFFVSAIVVVMFEWGSEAKHSLDLAGKLAYSLTDHITRILDASAAESIAEAMRQLVGNKNAKNFVDPLRSFAASINKLGGGVECLIPDTVMPDDRPHDEAGRPCDAGEHTTAEPSAAEPKATKPAEKPPSGREIMRDHVLAYRMGQLPRLPKDGVWYHGASDIKLWERDTLREFEQSIIEAAEDGIEVRRFFIFDVAIAFDPEQKIFRTLRKHAEISQRRPNYQWRVILRKEMPPDLRNEPFALFRDGIDSELEVGRGIDFHVGVSKAVALDLEAGFEEAWKMFRRPKAPPADEVTVLRHFDDEWRRNLPKGDPLKQYFEDTVRRLRKELEESIKDLFKEDAEKILAFIHPSPKRTDHNDDPHNHE